MTSTRLTRTVFDRFMAGESVASICEDYKIGRLTAEEILRAEFNRHKCTEDWCESIKGLPNFSLGGK